VATAKGFPALPVVVIPHPLGGLGPDAVKAKADKAVDGIIRLLTEPREKLLADKVTEVR
jgi:hypothetical protein